MSQLYVDNIRNRTGGPIGIPTGAVVTGVVTATTGNITGNLTVGGNADITGVLTYEDVTNVDSVGIVTARSGLRVVGGGVTAVGIATFYNGIDLNTSNSKINTGSGINVIFQDQGVDKLHFEVSAQGIRPNTANTGEVGNATYPFNKVTAQILDATGGVNVTGIVTASAGVQIGSGQSFGANGPTAVYYGDGSNLSGISAGGITTTKYSPTANAIIQIGLGTAQHHELTLSAGFTTITTSGGTYGESHSLVLIQPSSGIATVGFSTFFQFPSGATPSMSEGSSKVDLVSFVVKDIAGNTGTGATELLASAGLNYS